MPEQLGREVDVRHIAQHPLAQGDVRELRDIAAQRHLGIRAAIDVFEQEARQAPAGGLAKIGDVGDDHGWRPFPLSIAASQWLR